MFNVFRLDICLNLHLQLNRKQRRWQTHNLSHYYPCQTAQSTNILSLPNYWTPPIPFSLSSIFWLCYMPLPHLHCLSHSQPRALHTTLLPPARTRDNDLTVSVSLCITKVNNGVGSFLLSVFTCVVVHGRTCESASEQEREYEIVGSMRLI